MAKKASNGNPKDSGFDFSKFLDLDEEDSAMVPSTDTAGFDYNTIPHSRDEIVTGGLESNLEEKVESCIKAGKISWGDKRTLRRLAAENKELEDALRDTDAAIVDRADGYHTIVSNILREKSDLEGYALDDSDPYDSEVTGRSEQSLGSRAAQIQSSDLFKEIDRLETHRGELNGKRIGILEEIREIAERHSNDGLDELEAMIVLKIDAISKVQDITKVKFTDEDEELFDRGVDELTGYIHGSFDPLSEEDEYGDGGNFVEKTPLSLNDGHSDEEIIAMEEVSPQTEAPKSFDELFGAETPEAEAALEDGHSEEFSSEESPEDLFEALGDDTFEAEPQSEDEDISAGRIAEDDLQSEYDDEIMTTPIAPISTEFLVELEPEEIEEESAEAVADDLSVDSVAIDEHSVDELAVAEDGPWGEEDDDADLPSTEFLDGSSDELASDIVSDLDVSDDEASIEAAIQDFEAEGGSVQNSFILPVEADPSKDQLSEGYIGFEAIDPSDSPVRAVIFEELKEKYGISFSFEGDSELEE